MRRKAGTALSKSVLRWRKTGTALPMSELARRKGVWWWRKREKLLVGAYCVRVDARARGHREHHQHERKEGFAAEEAPVDAKPAPAGGVSVGKRFRRRPLRSRGRVAAE
jgi:hypothetical protein